MSYASLRYEMPRATYALESMYGANDRQSHAQYRASLCHRTRPCGIGIAMATAGVESGSLPGMLTGMGNYELADDLAPVSDALTRSIRVEVVARESREHSRPGLNEWVFEYTVRITNQGSETVQLISRHWIITDARQEVREVRGPGVVGEQPVLKPGDSHQYSSWCPLPTPTGSMRGTYQMVTSGGDEFDIAVAPFGLRSRTSLN